MSKSHKGWIGVDFDGTLATYDGWQGVIMGKPIMPMVARVKKWLSEGIGVRILTARVSSRNDPANLRPGEEAWSSDAHRKAIEEWCLEHIGQVLPVTAEKDFEMIELWDDRAVTVEKNTGRVLTYKTKFKED